MRVFRRSAIPLAAWLAMMTGGTFAQPNLGPAPAFDAAAYAQYLRKGDEVAVGRLAVQLQNGAVVAKSGASVLALPDSEYARWWLSESAYEIRERSSERENAFIDPAVPPRLRPFARYAATDGDGNFEIGDLPRGHYLFRGRLSLAFPREVTSPSETAAPYDVYGDQTRVRRSAVVFDYSVVWLDSQVVRVGNRPPDDIAFHLVARRDNVDAHRS
jgi:hypothetical protein